MTSLSLGWRQFRRAPVSSAAAVVVQALGVACTIVVFALVTGVQLSRPSGIDTRGRDLVQLRRVVAEPSFFERHDLGWFSYSEYTGFRDRGSALWDVAASFGRQSVPFRIHERVEVAQVALSTSNYLAVLGVRPVVGRTFNSEEEQLGGDAVCLLGRRLARRWGLEGRVPGAVVVMNDRPFSVVGVLPESFGGTNYIDRAEAWFPLGQRDALGAVGAGLARDARAFQLVARLKPGVTLSRAEAESSLILAQYAQSLARAGPEATVAVEPLLAFGYIERWQLTPVFAALGLATTLILAMTILNAAGLGMAVALRRQQDVAVRLVAGATPGRITLERLSEGVGVGLLAGVVGIVAAVGLLEFLGWSVIDPRSGIHPLYREFVAAASVLNWRMPGFVLAASLFTALGSGLLPALAAARTQPIVVLQGRDWTQRRALVVRGGVLVAQIAAATLLAFLGAASTRSVWKAQSTSPGLDVRNLVLAHVDPVVIGYEPSKARGFARNLGNRLNAAPEIRAATISRFKVVNHSPVVQRMTIVNAEGIGDTPVGAVPHDEVAANYFTAMGIPVVAGRAFRETASGGVPEIIVNRRAAADWPWPKGGPLGSVIRVGPSELAHTVVGVVGDVRSQGTLSDPTPFAYFPLYLPQEAEPSVSDMFGFTASMRTRGNVSSAERALRVAVDAIDPEVPVEASRPISEVIADTLAFERMLGGLNLVFAALASLVGAVGLYATASQIVAERGREFGLRLALGASPVDVCLLVVRWWGGTVGAGMTMGLALGTLLALSISGPDSLVLTVDGLVIAFVSVAILAVSAVAVGIPAWRVNRIHPAEALRLPEEAW